MSWRDFGGRIGDRRDWLLALLHTPVGGRNTNQIQGRTRLMKGAFLLSKEFEKQLGKDTDFEFHGDKHGPLDPLVFEATEELEDEGKMDIVSTRNSHGGDYYRLTFDGEQEAEAIWNSLNEKERELLEFIRNRHLEQSLSQILNYVYRRYPQYANNET